MDIILDREKGMDYVRRALSAGPDHIIHVLFRMSSKIIKTPHPFLDAEKSFHQIQPKFFAACTSLWAIKIDKTAKSSK